MTNTILVYITHPVNVKCDWYLVGQVFLSMLLFTNNVVTSITQFVMQFPLLKVYTVGCFTIIPCLIRLVLEENNRNQQLRNKAQLLPPLLSLPNNLNTEQYSITSFNRDTVTDCQLHNEDTMLKQVQMTQPDNQPVLVATFL